MQSNLRGALSVWAIVGLAVGASTTLGCGGRADGPPPLPDTTDASSHRARDGGADDSTVAADDGETAKIEGGAMAASHAEAGETEGGGMAIDDAAGDADSIDVEPADDGADTADDDADNDAMGDDDADNDAMDDDDAADNDATDGDYTYGHAADANAADPSDGGSTYGDADGDGGPGDGAEDSEASGDLGPTNDLLRMHGAACETCASTGPCGDPNQAGFTCDGFVRDQLTECLQVLGCALDAGCGVTLQDPSCFCGEADAATCATAPAGPCAAAYLGSGPSARSPAYVLANFQGFDDPGAMANEYAGCLQPSYSCPICF